MDTIDSDTYTGNLSLQGVALFVAGVFFSVLFFNKTRAIALAFCCWCFFLLLIIIILNKTRAVALAITACKIAYKLLVLDLLNFLVLF